MKENGVHTSKGNNTVNLMSNVRYFTSDFLKTLNTTLEQKFEGKVNTMQVVAMLIFHDIYTRA